MNANVEISERKKQRDILYKCVFTALMAALVYVGNFLSIPLASETRIHLGNSMCLLAGLLFGGVSGGLASGIGGAMYDLFNPLYISSAPFTFINKFAMGFAAGFIRRHTKDERIGAAAGAVVGQLIYILLYLGKNFIEQLLLGEPVSAALGVIGVKAGASFLNALAACVISIPLYYALSRALSRTAAGKYVN